MSATSKNRNLRAGTHGGKQLPYTKLVHSLHGGTRFKKTLETELEREQVAKSKISALLQSEDSGSPREEILKCIIPSEFLNDSLSEMNNLLTGIIAYFEDYEKEFGLSVSWPERRVEKQLARKILDFIPRPWYKLRGRNPGEENANLALDATAEFLISKADQTIQEPFKVERVSKESRSGPQLTGDLISSEAKSTDRNLPVVSGQHERVAMQNRKRATSASSDSEMRIPGMFEMEAAFRSQQAEIVKLKGNLHTSEKFSDELTALKASIKSQETRNAEEKVKLAEQERYAGRKDVLEILIKDKDMLEHCLKEMKDGKQPRQAYVDVLLQD